MVTAGRPFGSKDEDLPVEDPYRLLSLNVLRQAMIDQDEEFLRGHTNDLKLWLFACGIDFDVFHRTMWHDIPEIAEDIDNYIERGL